MTNLPIEVKSTAIIEPRVHGMNCRCGGTYRVIEHERPQPGMRRVDVQCRNCSAERTFWFRLVESELN